MSCVYDVELIWIFVANNGPVSFQLFLALASTFGRPRSTARFSLSFKLSVLLGWKLLMSKSISRGFQKLNCT